MIRQLATNALKKEVENVCDDSKKKLMYTGGIVLAGIGLYASYKVVKHFMIDKQYKEDLDYLESLNNNLDYDDYDYKDENISEDEQLKEKINEFNSRRLNSENDEIVSPNELNSYIENIKVDKDDAQVDLDINEDSDNYEEYN